MEQIQYKRAQTTNELYQILELQRTNIPSAISLEERNNEGFVTVHHTYDILKAMNDKCPHVIATHNEKVIAYALCMIRAFKNDIAILRPMFKQIENSLTADKSYIIMGQICVAKAYRKQGVFRGLYSFMEKEMRSHFDLIITEVDKKNKRSMNAHYAIGFKLLHSYTADKHDWNLIYLDL